MQRCVPFHQSVMEVVLRNMHGLHMCGFALQCSASPLHLRLTGIKTKQLIIFRQCQSLCNITLPSDQSQAAVSDDKLSVKDRWPCMLTIPMRYCLSAMSL